MIENFFGNTEAVATLTEMLANQRIPQTILLSGPTGVGKATLVRRFASVILQANAADLAKIEQDDLFLPHNIEMMAEREKLASDKRSEDPLSLSSHPDFVTFAPDGPLRQVSIQQIRLLKDQARLQPSRGKRRVFLIDQIDRANEQAANSLLKVLEEPPPHLLIFMTAENPYDLLPTIRSRSVNIRMHQVLETEITNFLSSRGLEQSERRARLANGSPGVAASLDIAAFDKRRAAMLNLLEVASRRAPFGSWIKNVESISASKSEKLEPYLQVLFLLLEDILLLAHGFDQIRNPDIARELKAIADAVSFAWLKRAVQLTDEMIRLLRRNIQKGIALDAFAVELRDMVAAA
ncbi:AAA family ATPase [Bryobacter aggregatus]|uniref:AAA family ATPase n=1 Tax=Bryobacter aggregatus TaxID=360054 RepID=UPI0004E19A5D|nr:AAA family ATPase [Bryobacter aggregatus]